MATTQLNADDTRMPARYFALFCEMLAAEGVDIPAMLTDIGLNQAQMEASEAELTLREFEALIRAALDSSSRTDLAFLLGRKINVSNHEILGYGMLTSATLEQAMKLASRYYRLMTPLFSMVYRRNAKTTEIIFQPTMLIGAQALRFLIETIVVSTHEVIKTLAQGKLPHYTMRVSYPEPQHARHYRQLDPAIVKFETEALPGIRLIFESSVMDRPLPLADRNALKMAEKRCEEMLQTASRDVGVSGWVSMMLREANDGFPSLSELAHLCNQSPRTLERQMEKEGVRYTDLAKGIRHEKACDLLRSSKTPVTQIAYQLGYRELSSFTRAFIRESGMSPREFRKVDDI